MSDTNDLDIEQLLSDFIDEELSERERTEVKRLVHHNEHLADQLRRLQRQKDLMASLPIDTAPVHIVDNVKSALERKLILDEYTHVADESAGIRHLLLRRTLSVAAMFILPVGILAWIVFNIIAPAPVPDRPIAVNIPRKNIEEEFAEVQKDRIETAEKAVAKNTVAEYLFDSTLQFSSANSIDINNFIKKAVYDNDLIDCTIPKRPASQLGKSEYHITCDIAGIAVLLDDLAALWDKCDTVSFDLAGDAVPGGITIQNATHQQVAAIFEGTGSSDDRVEKARYFSSLNALNPNLPTLAKSDLTDTGAGTPLTVPIEPIMTSSNQTTTKPAWKKTGQTATLLIIVQDL